VKHIIVCGHYDCGGVKASLEPIDPSGPLENWLRNIRDVYRIHRRELTMCSELRDKQRKLVELNVIEQVCLSVYVLCASVCICVWACT
jgi:carbonic anhydrase